MPQTINDYLRTYPTVWPIFKTKFYRKSEDGWWNPLPRQRREKKKSFFF